MPPPWERRVIFFANLLSLFYGNEEETQVLRDEVGALETYGGRLIPILNLIYQGPDNLLVLEGRPQEILLDYFRSDLRLTLPEIEIVAHDVYTAVTDGTEAYAAEVQGLLAMLRRHPAEWIHGYVTDKHLVRLAELIGKKTISSYEGGRRGNNKLLLYEQLRSAGLPVFETRVAKNSEAVRDCLSELKAKGYCKAVVKSQIGASGIGMGKIDLKTRRIADVPAYLFFEGPCLVQGWLDETRDGIRYIGSPSVQMFVRDDLFSVYDLTEQILSRESIHEGNIAPPPYLRENDETRRELLSQAEAAGRWLHQQGYRGTASVDFQVVENNGRREVRVCEINARVTGATYPAILARHFLPKGSWLMRNIRFFPGKEPPAILEALNREGILFHPGQKRGVLPINLNAADDGTIVKGQFLFLGKDFKETSDLLERISRIPAIKGRYDRD